VSVVILVVRFNVCLRKLLLAMCMFEKEVVFLVDSSTWIESVVRLLVAYVVTALVKSGVQTPKQV